MKRRMIKIIWLFFFLPVAQKTTAQQQDDPVAVWLLPGAFLKVSKKVSLFGELGYSRYYRAGLGYMQAYITVHKNIVLNPGYMYFIYKRPGQAYRQEHFVMNAVIAQVTLGKVLIEDRNMLWNRIRTDNSPLHYYRNRFRVTWSFQLWATEAKLYGYDEGFYSFNNHSWSRNRLAAGTSYDVMRHTNIDITYIRQWDRTAGWLHLFFIMATWKIP